MPSLGILPFLPIRTRRRMMAWLGLLAIIGTLFTASFAGLPFARQDFGQTQSADEIVICTPGGIQILDLTTGKIKAPLTRDHGAERLCLLCLPIASQASLHSLSHALLDALPSLRILALSPPVQVCDQPSMALLGFDHDARAPPSRVVV